MDGPIGQREVEPEGVEAMGIQKWHGQPGEMVSFLLLEILKQRFLEDVREGIGLHRALDQALSTRETFLSLWKVRWEVRAWGIPWSQLPQNINSGLFLTRDRFFFMIED